MRLTICCLLCGALVTLVGCDSSGVATTGAPDTSATDVPKVTSTAGSSGTIVTSTVEEPPSQTLFDQESGVGSFSFSGYGPHPEDALDVYYYAPEGDLRASRILVVMPGRGRNAAQYRDEWLEQARRESVLLLVPEFSDETYSVTEYNLGSVVDESGSVLPEEEWTFAVIEGLFDYVSRAVTSEEAGYYLFGHSAGGQFVHRFMLFMENNRVVQAVSANSGWYTATEPKVDFPYGLRDGPAEDEADLRRMVAEPLVVMLGSMDTDPNSDGLRSDSGSDEQGATRLDRGFYFFRTGQQAAEDTQTVFAWELEIVNGVGHSNEDIAEAAAAKFFP